MIEKDYILPIAGLSIGCHNFEYKIDDSFFEKLEFSEVKKGLVKVNLNVEKKENNYIFTFEFKGNVRVVCDRCNDEYDQVINNKAVIFLKYGVEYKEESDDIIIIPKEQGEFDVSSLIYEYIILSLPIHKVHPDISQCNQDVIKYLEKHKKRENKMINAHWKCLEELKNKKDNY